MSPKPAKSIISIEGARLEPPEIGGFANRCTIERFEDFLSFKFFELVQDGTAIPVRRLVMGIDETVLRLWPTAEKLARSMSETHPVTDVSEWVDRTAPAFHEPAALANLVLVARSGLAGTLDFHYVTPHSMHIVTQQPGNHTQDDLTILPVVSIQVPSTMMTALFLRIESLLPTLKKRMLEFRDFQNPEIFEQ